MKWLMIIFSVFATSFSHANKTEMVCADTKFDNGYKSGVAIVDEDELIKVNNTLFKNGTIICNVSFDYKTLKNNKRMRIETGTYDGIKYRIYFSDGSGTIQGLSTNTLDNISDKYETNWSTRCKRDEMDDKHWCSLGREDLRIGIWKDGTPFVSIGSSHYPDSDIAIRVDKNKPITASEKIGFTNAQSLEIIDQLKKGNSVLTRYQEWPYQSNKDTSLELFGFPQAWEILQKIYESANSQQ
jgi:hypothetical protein